MVIDNPVWLGIIVIILVTVAFGGSFVLSVVNGDHEANELQKNYYRAGHAHAGMFVTLGILLHVLMSSEGVPNWGSFAADFVLYAAILMPAGFFLSVTGRDPQKPNGLKVLIPIGALSLVGGLIGTGVALIMTA